MRRTKTDKVKAQDFLATLERNLNDAGKENTELRAERFEAVRLLGAFELTHSPLTEGYYDKVKEMKSNISEIEFRYNISNMRVANIKGAIRRLKEIVI